MNAAQAAWAVLTGLFLAAAVTLLLVPTGPSSHDEMGWLCFVLSVGGWVALGAMITNDRRP